MIRIALLVVLLCPQEKAQDVPKGDTFKFVFDQSKIFPGTTRDVSIYVPKQYDPEKPACVYVGQDGGGFNAQAAFDRLSGVPHRRDRQAFAPSASARP